MKKLLSLLSISGIMGSASSTVISCEEEQTVTKVDISGKTFDNPIGADTAEVAYQEIRSTIGSWASPQINADQVKSDMHIGVTLYESDETTVVAEDSAAITAGDFRLKLNVDDQNTYFNTMEPTWYDVTIQAEATEKVNLPVAGDIALDNATSGTTTYENVLSDLKDKLATASGVSKPNITAGITAGTITVTMLDGDGTTAVEASGTFSNVGTNGKVTVTVSGNDFFNDGSIDYALEVV